MSGRDKGASGSDWSAAHHCTLRGQCARQDSEICENIVVQSTAGELVVNAGTEKLRFKTIAGGVIPSSK